MTWAQFTWALAFLRGLDSPSLPWIACKCGDTGVIAGEVKAWSERRNRTSSSPYLALSRSH